VIAVTGVADRSGRRLRARLRHQQAHELHRAPGADVHVLAVNLVITLIGTVILALLVLLAPLRRAVRFKPGEGLRYA